MTQPRSRIWTKLDFEKDGKQVGYLHLPHSVDRSGAGTIAIPCAVLRNGDGPSSLLMAGIHGDEFEGQVALTRLIRDLQAKDITGRLIIVPAINLPAAIAGTRISPIDDRNLNRCFPGDPNGSPTEQIAYYIETELGPMCNSWLDLHSGGASMAFMPYAQIILSRDEALNKRALAALEAFGAPLSVIQAFSDEPNMSNSAATRNNAIHLGTEAGGSGSVGPDGVRLCYDGTLRSLVHLGHLSARNSRIAIPPRPEKVRWIEIASRDYYTYAPQAGLFEPVVKLGDMVKNGQIYGFVQFIDDPLREPAEVRFEASGLVVCMRHPGRCERGDCLGHLASDIKR